MKLLLGIWITFVVLYIVNTVIILIGRRNIIKDTETCTDYHIGIYSDVMNELICLDDMDESSSFKSLSLFLSSMSDFAEGDKVICISPSSYDQLMNYTDVILKSIAVDIKHALEKYLSGITKFDIVTRKTTFGRYMEEHQVIQLAKKNALNIGKLAIEAPDSMALHNVTADYIYAFPHNCTESEMKGDAYAALCYWLETKHVIVGEVLNCE